MVKQYILIVLFAAFLMASDTLVDYIKSAQKNIQMDREQTLIKRRSAFGIEAKRKERFANFSGDILYTDTNAHLLPRRFHTTDISLADTIDLFNKSATAIESIRLQEAMDKVRLDQQKEQLFLTLVDMIAAYQKTKKILELHRDIYQEQKQMLKQIKKAEKTGAISKIQRDRFANMLSLLEARIAQEDVYLATMRRELQLYVPDKAIPPLKYEELKTDMMHFLAHRPNLKAKEIASHLAANDAKAIQRRWLPDALMGVAYQQNSDPTANGNNYSLFAGLHFELNANLSKKIQAAKVRALQRSCEAIQLKIAAKAQYLRYLGLIQSAQREMKILQVAKKRALSTLKSMKSAYLKHYVTFTSYLQTLKDFLRIEERFINASIINQKNIAILNILGSGVLYE